MKTILSLLLAVVSLSAISCGSSDKAPSAVRQAFKAKFPNATRPDWEQEQPGIWESSFIDRGSHKTANFDSTGSWLETEATLPNSALPESVKSALGKTFADYKLREASIIESQAEGTIYEAEIAKGEAGLDVFFLPDGRIMRQVPHNEKEARD